MLEAGEEEKEGGSGAQSQISESKQLFVVFINESNNIFWDNFVYFPNSFQSKLNVWIQKLKKKRLFLIV